MHVMGVFGGMTQAVVEKRSCSPVAARDNFIG